MRPSVADTLYEEEEDTPLVKAGQGRLASAEAALASAREMLRAAGVEGPGGAAATKNVVRPWPLFIGRA